MTVRAVVFLLVMSALVWQTACMQRPAADAGTTRPPDQFSAQGRVEGLSDPVEVSAGISGRIERVLVGEGDVVAAGALIAELDCGPLRAEAEHRQADLAVARANQTRLHRGARTEEREEALARVRAAEGRAERALLDQQRAERLFKTDRVISKAEFDQAREASAVADADLAAARQRAAVVLADPLPEEAARAQALVDAATQAILETKAKLSQCSVKAPIAGVVLRRHVEPGERLDAFTRAPLVTLGDVNGHRVRIEVDERDVGRVRVGQTITIRADALGDQKVRGRIVRIGRLMGRKKVFSGEPQDKYDRDVLEAIAELDTPPDRQLPIGLRVTAYFDADASTPGTR
jgi:multidrug resistance efflux pump